jgi:hypothetical protein
LIICLYLFDIYFQYILLLKTASNCSIGVITGQWKFDLLKIFIQSLHRPSLSLVFFFYSYDSLCQKLETYYRQLLSFSRKQYCHLLLLTSSKRTVKLILHLLVESHSIIESVYNQIRLKLIIWKVLSFIFIRLNYFFVSFFIL